MTRKTHPAIFHSIILAITLSITIAPGVLAARNSIPHAPTAPAHSVYFQAMGLPDGVVFDIVGTRVNNGGHPTTYTTTFTTPDLSAALSADPDSEFTYTGFPASLVVGEVTYTLISVLPASPFIVGASGGFTIVVATYQVTCQPPEVTVNPTDQTVQYGDAASFGVTAMGTAPLTYEWYKDNALIEGADQSTYAISFTMMSDAGTYHAVVRNSCGAVTSAQAQLAVNKADQFITFDPPASPAVFGTSFWVNPTASSGLAVSLLTAGSCTNVGYQVSMTSGTGTCTLTASQAGDDNYNPAPDEENTVQAARADQTIDFPALGSPAVYGTSFTVSATTSSGLGVTFEAEGVCTLVGTTVTMTSGTGTCTLTASQAGDDNYNPAPNVMHTVQAAKADQTINFPAPASPAVYGTPFTVSATTSSGLGVTFEAEGVCTLVGTTATMTSGTGTCTLTASQAGDDNYNPALNVMHTVQAAKADQTINFSAPASPAVYGTSYTVSATASSGLGVSFQASGVCSLIGTTVTMTSGTGTCTLTASQAGDDNYNPALNVMHTVQAAKADQTINFSAPASPTVYGTSFVVSATASSGLGVTFEASGVCTLVGTTVTMTSGTGACTLTASQAGDDKYNPAEDASNEVQATRAGQNIIFPQPASPVKYQTSFVVSPTATSGLPVILFASGSCTNNGYTVTMTQTSGVCLLTTSQAGNFNYLPAEAVQRSVDPAPNGNMIYIPLLFGPGS